MNFNVGDLDVPEWQALKGLAFGRKHTGDIDGAIEAMVKAISLTSAVPSLTEETALSFNYLADLYLTKNDNDQAEGAIRDGIMFSPNRYPLLLGDNLLILAEVQRRKGEFREALASAEEALHLFQQHSHSHGVTRAEELMEKLGFPSPAGEGYSPKAI